MVLFLALCGKALSPESAACYSCASAVSAHKQMEIGNSGSARRKLISFGVRLGSARALESKVGGFCREVYIARTVSPPPELRPLALAP